MSFYLILQIIYLLIPAAVANMVPVFVRNHFKFLAKPLDIGLSFYGKRILGSHKTFRGLIFGMLGSLVVVFIQNLIYANEFFYNLSLIDYSSINLLVFGIFAGFFVLLFDSIASFVKRRLNFKPGERFYILDQINGGLGFSLFIFLFYIRSWPLFIIIILVWIIGHFLLKYLGYILGIDKEKI